MSATHEEEPHRLIVLTDIKRGLENDDVQSMVRLLLYSNVINIEGLIAVSSCWHRRGGREKDARIIHRLIDAYGAVRENLAAHEPGFPEPSALHAVTMAGVAGYGVAPGNGYADARHDNNPAVRHIIRALEAEDERPVWFSLWGGANTLAQALWTAERTRTPAAFDRLLARARIHAISDQDTAAHWMRDRYGDRLFTIVSPSPASGGKHYFRATWPGISADRFGHGSPNGVRGGGFPGAETELVTRRWERRNVRRGRYGRHYPLHRFIMEGDTPAFLALIPNGLNDPEQPDAGGWGGRYELAVPERFPWGREERHPIWTDTAGDTVRGIDGRQHTSPQATIWRWRSALQNDFAARISWTLSDRPAAANHPPVAVVSGPDRLTVTGGTEVTLDASGSVDPDRDALTFSWFDYPEAVGRTHPWPIVDASSPVARLRTPVVEEPTTATVILAVTDDGTPPLTRYRRIHIKVMPHTAAPLRD